MPTKADRPTPLSEDLGVHPVAVVLLKYRQLIRLAIRGTGFYALLVGVATLVGGDTRFGGPSYSTAVEIATTMDSSPAAFWGASVVLAGGLALASPRSISTCGLLGIAAWSVVFGLSFLVSVNTNPLAGVSGMFAHGFITLVVVTLLVVRLVDKGVDRR